MSLRPGRPIELDVVVESEIRPWRYPPTFDLHYDELLRDRFEGGELEPWDGTTNKDLASALTMVLLGGTSLAEYLPRDTRNVVLTLARIWSAVATEAVYSKDDAAGWALSRLPEEHRAVLELAHAAYRGEAEDSWDELGPQVRAYADHLVSEIERARAETDRAT